MKIYWLNQKKLIAKEAQDIVLRWLAMSCVLSNILFQATAYSTCRATAFETE